jgi:hypothetical protein
LITNAQRDLYQASIVAKSDDGDDWSASGYVIVEIGDWTAISFYSHCSCYGTWESLVGGGPCTDGKNDPAWDWQGTPEQMYDMDRRHADPNMPERVADDKDYNYGLLVDAYDQYGKHYESKHFRATGYVN